MEFPYALYLYLSAAADPSPNSEPGIHAKAITSMADATSLCLPSYQTEIAATG